MKKNLIVKKIFNNNTLLAEDEKQLEYVLLGRGISFQKKKGDLVDETKIDKIFVLESKEVTQKFVSLINEVPINQLELVSKMIKAAEEKLNISFNNSIYIGLTDHINYAIERYRNGIQLKNVLLWDIKKFYQKEYEAALESLKIIEYYEDITFDEDEAGHIALHYVNAQQNNGEMKYTLLVTEVIEEVLKIIKYHFNISIDEQSLNYNRLITHLRYFIRRILSHDLYTQEDDDYFYMQVKRKYPESFQCVMKIQTYFEKKFNVEISLEEVSYLTLHIQRVTQRGKNRD